MANFTGSECLICREKFREDEDIVVCPDCGTPYHRECYMKEGSCINTALHEKKESWSRSQKQKEEEGESGADTKICKNCGAENASHLFFCEKCGCSLVESLKFGADQQDAGSGQQQGRDGAQNYQNYGNRQNSYGFAFDPADKYCGLDPEERITENVTVSEAADFVGANIPYYLLLFKRMKMSGKKITLNISCILFPELYFAYRKMWKEAIITILLSTVFSIPLILVYVHSYMKIPMSFLKESDFRSTMFGLISEIANYASMAVNVVACLFGNWLYSRHMERKISLIKMQCGDDDPQEYIKQCGGVSVGAAAGALVIQFIAVAAVLFSFFQI